jgi:hypothetical protein
MNKMIDNDSTVLILIIRSSTTKIMRLTTTSKPFIYYRNDKTKPLF